MSAQKPSIEKLPFECLQIIAAMQVIQDVNSGQLSYINVLEHLVMPAEMFGKQIPFTITGRFKGQGTFDAQFVWEKIPTRERASAGPGQTVAFEGDYCAKQPLIVLPPTAGEYALLCCWRVHGNEGFHTATTRCVVCFDVDKPVGPKLSKLSVVPS